MKTEKFSLSKSEVSQLLAQLEVTPHGEFDYGDWIAALVDWRDLQVGTVCGCVAHVKPLCVAASITGC